MSVYLYVCMYVCMGGGSNAKTMKILSVKIGPTIPNNISYSPISSAVFELLDHKYAETHTHTHFALE